MFLQFSSIVVFMLSLVACLSILLLLAFIYFARPRYVPKKLLTQPEQQFLRVLKLAIGSRYEIFCQVRLASLVTLDVKSFIWGHFRPLGAKCVDYVLYDLTSSSVVLVIELDDTTHQRRLRKRRDWFVDVALERASVPILHVPLQNSYRIAELKSEIYHKIRGDA